MVKKQRQLTLNKGKEKLIDAIIDQAKHSQTQFDWFDAAVLSFKMTQSLLGQADKLLQANIETEFENGNMPSF